MKKNSLTKTIALLGTTVFMMSALAGCGKAATEVTAAENTEAPKATEAVIAEEAVAKTDSVASAPYFTKGVYLNYAEGATTRDYFYVFYDEGAGYTEDGTSGTGLPFCCDQEDGKITFSFGGYDSVTEVFEVTSTENGVVTGSFDDGRVLIFEPVADVDPDTFNAQNYVRPASEAIFESPLGWKVNYNSDLFEVNQSANLTSFVYTGESAGTNMIMVTYEPGMTGKEAVDKMAESRGSDNMYRSQGTFPGTENVDGYWATLAPAEGGSGYYETAIARDYMEGYLLFELIGHNGEDEEMNMTVSDNLAMIIDSLTFPYEQ